MTREQFITYVESSQRAFRRFLTALCCGDSQLADDIAQESYMKAYLSCDGLKDVEKFNSWLYRIGYTTFLNFKRSVRATVSYELATGVAAELMADSRFKYQELYTALDRLPPSERTAILLYYLEGYSVAEIAGIIDAKLDAVRQQLTRGRNHLRGLLTV